MLSHSPSKKSLQIQEDNKLFSKLQSKERTSSVSSAPSFRVYYGGISGSVPFLWESKPGTPKHPCFSDSSSLPPLTPPPSYYSHNYSKQNSKKNPRSNLLSTLRKSHLPSSPASSPSFSSVSSWSSLHSLVSFPTTSSKGRSRFSSERSSFDEEEEVSIGSPNSTLCFGLGRALRGQRTRRLVCAS
ncbi:hypothetical protein RHMOL_Rhmol06G0033600 [Rhododendron molle]|uniref:Uncharacterized protein n=1 Tax=Rhododendron molle TaxID=49168 RepID=A0ACC0NAD9_RHOML|nr:hypothetical protein RHMOL_Rhmol06G0033600 [Rhododendron molle]